MLYLIVLLKKWHKKNRDDIPPFEVCQKEGKGRNPDLFLFYFKRGLKIMGRFLIPCCCVCGKSPMKWHDEEWENNGGLQDFCPKHADRKMIQYINEQFQEKGKHEL